MKESQPRATLTSKIYPSAHSLRLYFSFSDGGEKRRAEACTTGRGTHALCRRKVLQARLRQRPQTLKLQRSSSTAESFGDNEAENRRASAVVATKKGAARPKHQEAPTLRRSVTPLKARWHPEMETITQKTNDEEKRKVNSTTVGAPGQSCTPVAHVVAAVAFNCTE